MTDRLTCPDCDGVGTQQFGPLTVLCLFCAGRGYVGDDNEPAHRGEVDMADVDPMNTTPAWEEPAAKAIPGCPQCFGTGRVVGLGGDVRGGRPSSMTESPCPACSTTGPGTR